MGGGRQRTVSVTTPRNGGTGKTLSQTEGSMLVVGVRVGGGEAETFQRCLLCLALPLDDQVSAVELEIVQA